jgi:hypothetical protein
MVAAATVACKESCNPRIIAFCKQCFFIWQHTLLIDGAVQWWSDLTACMSSVHLPCLQVLFCGWLSFEGRGKLNCKVVALPDLVTVRYSFKFGGNGEGLSRKAAFYCCWVLASTRSSRGVLLLGWRICVTKQRPTSTASPTTTARPSLSF